MQWWCVVSYPPRVRPAAMVCNHAVRYFHIGSVKEDSYLDYLSLPEKFPNIQASMLSIHAYACTHTPADGTLVVHAGHKRHCVSTPHQHSRWCLHTPWLRRFQHHPAEASA